MNDLELFKGCQKNEGAWTVFLLSRRHLNEKGGKQGEGLPGGFSFSMWAPTLWQACDMATDFLSMAHWVKILWCHPTLPLSFLWCGPFFSGMCLCENCFSLIQPNSQFSYTLKAPRPSLGIIPVKSRISTVQTMLIHARSPGAQDAGGGPGAGSERITTLIKDIKKSRVGYG